MSEAPEDADRRGVPPAESEDDAVGNSSVAGDTETCAGTQEGGEGGPSTSPEEPPPRERGAPDVAEQPPPGPEKPESETPEPEKDAIAAAPLDLAAQLMELKRAMDRLQRTFDDRLRLDASREAMIDRLHGELQEHRADLALKLLTPLCLDLISLYDDVGRLSDAHRATAGESEAATTLYKLFSDFQANIEAILYRHGFETFSTDERRLDGKRQRVEAVIPTGDTELDGTVAERRRKGFTYGERLIRPEVVAAYKLQSGGK